ncbi:DUF6668 family protein [Nocardiopsis sp. NPDC057823]|uniref:DUF6668 family protein n=1 Tax=Nocardiopsis sp. NPDC057823 TaxID=3346256 RepID=UPI00366FC54F
MGLPLRVFPQSASVWWVGAHGGSGESTFAKLLPGSVESQHTWPQSATPLPGGIPVVLMARTNLSGLESARNALTQWASGTVPGIQLLGLALVSDAPGKLPKPLKDFAHLVGGGAPRVWRVPWMEQWRTDPPTAPDPRGMPAELRKLIKSVQVLIQKS